MLRDAAANRKSATEPLAATKVPRSGVHPLCEDGNVQSAIGRAEGALRSARVFLFEMTEELDKASEAGEEISIRQRMMLRLACAQVAAAAKETIQIVYDAAGGSAVYEANGIQRCFRDLYMRWSPKTGQVAKRESPLERPVGRR